MPKRTPRDPSGPDDPAETAGKTTAGESLITFDPAKLRLRQASRFGVRDAMLQTSAHVGKPNGKDFVRVNPDPSHQLATLMIVAPGQAKDLYLIHPDLVTELAGEALPFILFETVGGDGVPFIWACRWAALGDDGASTWHTSALEAANLAMTHWVRVISSMPISAYYTKLPEDKFPEPVWPARPFSELLEMAFRRRYIDRLDHPVVKKLRGAL